MNKLQGVSEKIDTPQTCTQSTIAVRTYLTTRTRNMRDQMFGFMIGLIELRNKLPRSSDPKNVCLIGKTMTAISHHLQVTTAARNLESTLGNVAEQTWTHRPQGAETGLW